MAETKLNKKNFDGIKSAADMLNQLNSKERDKILTNISQKDPDMADRIRQRMFPFEDLVTLEPVGLQLLLQSISKEKLTLALRNKQDEFRNIIYGSLPTRSVSEIKETLEQQGPQSLTKITAAQQEIINKAKILLDQGKIHKKT